jgi:hypothetical protein
LIAAAIPRVSIQELNEMFRTIKNSGADSEETDVSGLPCAQKRYAGDA